MKAQRSSSRSQEKYGKVISAQQWKSFQEEALYIKYPVCSGYMENSRTTSA